MEVANVRETRACTDRAGDALFAQARREKNVRANIIPNYRAMEPVTQKACLGKNAREAPTTDTDVSYGDLDISIALRSVEPETRLPYPGSRELGMKYSTYWATTMTMVTPTKIMSA